MTGPPTGLPRMEKGATGSGLCMRGAWTPAGAEDAEPPPPPPMRGAWTPAGAEDAEPPHPPVGGGGGRYTTVRGRLWRRTWDVRRSGWRAVVPRGRDRVEMVRPFDWSCSRSGA